MEMARKQAENSYSGIMKLAFPVIVAMLSITMMGAVDTIFVGQLGRAELGAVGQGSILVMTMISILFGLAAAVTTLISQYYGAKQYEHCQQVLRSAMMLVFMVGGLFLVTSAFTEEIFSLMGPSQAVQKLGSEYAQWRLFGGLFVAFNYVMTGYFQGIGNTKTPMWVTVWANLINIILDYFLILGVNGFTGFGVKGAAIATLSANIISSIAFFVIYRKSAKPFQERARPVDLETRPAHFKNLVKLSLPMSTQNFLGLFSFFVLFIFIGWMGDLDLASNQIVMQLDMLAFLPIVGLSQATQIVVGQFIGSGDPSGARVCVNRSIIMGVVFEFVMAICIILFATTIVGWFTNDLEVISLTSSVIMLAPLWMVADAVYMTCFGVLRGAGDVKWSMIVGSTIHWVVKLPLAYWFGLILGMGLYGAWIGCAVQMIVSSSLFLRRVYKGKWMEIQLVEPEPEAIPVT